MYVCMYDYDYVYSCNIAMLVTEYKYSVIQFLHVKYRYLYMCCYYLVFCHVFATTIAVATLSSASVVYPI